MRLISGVDGCRAGWIVISKDLDTSTVSWRMANSTRELLHSGSTPEVMAIDIPIGLPEYGPRNCDIKVRKLLGPGRASSVFPAPIRPILVAKDYDEACQIRYRIEKKKLSLQSWSIMHKIIEVDSALRQDPDLRKRLREVHPELCFFFLAGKQSLRYNKKGKQGHAERYELLEPIFGDWLGIVLEERQRLSSTKDDVLDAFVALWTAERIVNGISQTIPSDPSKDAFGLRMEMVT